MCGIAGIVDFSRPSLEHSHELRGMQQRLKHRGPDGASSWFGAHCALAHTRLVRRTRNRALLVIIADCSGP